MNTHTRSLILTLAFLGLTVLLSLTPLAQSERASAASIMGKRQESNAKVPPCAGAHESGLPLPSSFLPNKLPQFQAQLKTFLTSGKYRNLNWCEDKGLRDTGPFINGVSYGVHPTVKIYYSPSVIRWLLRTNPDELIPDGAIIIKEQYSPPPAARYQFQPPPLPKDWTIMIKDSKGSKDGWYWAEIWDTQCADNNDPPFAVPYAGFGIYCTRCHASAEKELTFSDTKNIKGFPGDPETYFIDLSWASASSPHPSSPPPPCTETSDSDYGVPTGGHSLAHPDLMQQLKSLTERPAAGSPNSQFISFYNSIAPVPLAKVRKIPGETFDHIFAQNLGPAAAATPGPSPNPNQFLTSDACMGCHSAGTYGNVMLYTGARQPDGSTPTMNVSPFGEWRWSPMGLAGRDPIFYAQLDSEIAFVKSFFKNDPAKMEENIKLVNNTCFKCHGVMGKRRLDDDHGGTGKGNFEREFIYTTYDSRPQPGNRQAYVYGALARDGVSCMACHRIVKDQPSPGEPDPLTDFLKNRITGNFTTGNPGEIFGPFEDQEIVTDPMNNALGIKPKHDPYIKTSRMCGNCHTINLPIMDNPTLNPDKPHLEQVTYLEWLNSGYQDEFGNNPKAQTCQDCHMATKYSNAKGTLNIPLIQQPIAFIEDDQYPQVGNRLARDKIRVRFREKGFARHQLQGLNVSLLEIFRQSMSGFNSNGNNMQASLVLGVRQNDYMSGLDDLSTAIDAFVEQAQNSTAELSLSPVTISNDKLFANVLVTNKAGHRLPSGVGFRRAFLEFRVIDGSNGQTVWCSGCTNELGVILKGNSGPRLPSELFDVYKDGSKPLNHDYPTPCNNQYLPGINPQHYQPHFFWNIEKGSGSAITRQDQVQIYEELNLNVQCALTTSFLRRDYQLKDNRLLPYGWTSTGPLRPDNTPYIPEDFLHETRPVKVGDDPAYKNGSGTNVVRYEVALPAGTNPGNLTVKATLYYQSIPPYYLNDRFTQAPNEPATQRLYFLTSNLQTKGTPIENWKLKIASGSQTVVAR